MVRFLPQPLPAVAVVLVAVGFLVGVVARGDGDFGYRLSVVGCRLRQLYLKMHLTEHHVNSQPPPYQPGFRQQGRSAICGGWLLGDNDLYLHR